MPQRIRNTFWGLHKSEKLNQMGFFLEESYIMFGIILGGFVVLLWVFLLFGIVFELFVGFLLRFFVVLLFIENHSWYLLKKEAEVILIVKRKGKNHIAQCLFSIEGPCTILAWIWQIWPIKIKNRSSHLTSDDWYVEENSIFSVGRLHTFLI